ncbi:MAG: hypothetical protein A3K10_09815 [Bacteroidetes bacterium RIFCSPLOWO2_12_FULL_31_6]|nr:MAG: hypothetical protein A3K10_09815 [Bacteroidetes bacterium RIFCSPLOWO2_12_FULL_31_6]
MSEISLIKQSIHEIERNGVAIGDWLPKKAVMRFFNYGETQIRELELANNIEISTIGRRKFYSKKSIIALIEKNIIK